jgi:hypothetical protein
VAVRRAPSRCSPEGRPLPARGRGRWRCDHALPPARRSLRRTSRGSALRRDEDFEGAQAPGQIGEPSRGQALEAIGERLQHRRHSVVEVTHGLLHRSGQDGKAGRDAVPDQGEESQEHRLCLHGEPADPFALHLRKVGIRLHGGFRGQSKRGRELRVHRRPKPHRALELRRIFPRLRSEAGESGQSAKRPRQRRPHVQAGPRGPEGRVTRNMASTPTRMPSTRSRPVVRSVVGPLGSVTHMAKAMPV